MTFRHGGCMLWLLLAGLCGCGKPAGDTARASITVAAAANLTDAFSELARQFKADTAIEVVLSFGSTAQLAQQIENGAPFDVFAAADTEHIDELIKKGALLPQSRAVYARGLVAVWIPKGDSLGVQTVADLVKPQVRAIAIATPAVAPYGAAAVKSLQTSGLWPKLKDKVVYANNVNMAKQFALSGNADAAFTAYALVLHEPGRIIQADGGLRTKIEQALGILKSSRNPQATQRFRQFVLGQQGRSIFQRYGYDSP